MVVTTTRIVMPETQVRPLCWKSQEMKVKDKPCASLLEQNSTFAGDKLLTTPNPDVNEDMKMFELQPVALPCLGLDLKKPLSN